MKRKNISILRFIIQISYLILVIAGVLLHNYVMLFITITAILLGPIFCGWMCFLGLYQDSCRYVGSLIKKKPIEIPEKAHSFLKYSRFIILAASILIGGIFLFPSKVWGTFAGLVKGHVIINIALYFIIILGIFSLFTRRFFCRYLCTFGAKLGLFGLLRPITINRKDSCVSCQLCSKECPMGIQVDKIHSLADANCVNCLKCVECCPNGSLKIGLRSYLKP